MPKHLAVFADILQEKLFLFIDYDMQTIIIKELIPNYITKGQFLNELKTYSFDNINEFIKDYSEKCVILFHNFTLKKLIKINEQNINKLIREYKEYKRVRPDLYLVCHKTSFNNFGILFNYQLIDSLIIL